MTTAPAQAPTPVRTWLGLDKRPLSRYDVIIAALLVGCYIAEPDAVKLLTGAASFGAGLALAAFGK